MHQLGVGDVDTKEIKTGLSRMRSLKRLMIGPMGPKSNSPSNRRHCAEPRGAIGWSKIPSTRL